MARFFHVHLPHRDPRELRAPQPGVALLLILLLAVLAAVWMNVPPVASPLPIHPPG
jgi:hypothetical protein